MWGAAHALAPLEARVRHVVDGDTVVLDDGRLVRLLGINAPELGRDGAPDEPLAREARTRLNRLVQGQRVQLRFEAQTEDHYGRLLAHVTLHDGTDVQALLLREGLAFLVAIPPDVGAVERYARIEHTARAAGRGVWRLAYYRPVSADAVAGTATGFRRVTGVVRHVGIGRDAVYLDLSRALALVIPKSDWHYFGGNASRFKGTRVEASGWLTRHDGRYQLRVGHPAVLRVLDSPARSR